MYICQTNTNTKTNTNTSANADTKTNKKNDQKAGVYLPVLNTLMLSKHTLEFLQDSENTLIHTSQDIHKIKGTVSTQKHAELTRHFQYIKWSSLKIDPLIRFYTHKPTLLIVYK